MNIEERRQAMIILCGPSASGKTEVAKHLGKAYDLKKVVTNTTRPMRVGEVDKIDYNFVSVEEFLKLKAEDKFVETTFYNHNYYGCLKSQIGDDKIVVLEPEGVKNFLKLNDKKICVFYLNCNEEVRVARMRSRLDKEEDIRKRINNDLTSFDTKNLPQYNFVINTNYISIEEASEIIYNKYQEYLKTL